MMSRLKNNSITSKLIIYMMTLIAIIVTLFIYANMETHKEHLERSQQDMINSLGQIYVSLFERPLSQGDYIKIESILQTKTLPAFIKQVKVTDLENNLAAKHTNEVNSCEKAKDIEFPLINSGFNQKVGVVYITSTSCIVREKILTSIIVYLVAAIVVLIFCYISIQKLIHYSLKPMREVIEKSTNTDKLTQDLVEASPDEIRPLINHLGQAFETMTKAEMADEVAHNLSSPLFGMSGLIPKLKNKLSEEEWSLLNGLFGKIDRITQKLNFSSLSKGDSGKAIYVDHIISDMIFEYNETIFNKDKRVTIEFDKKDSSFGLFSHFPKNILEETLINIFNNAYDASYFGGKISVVVNEVEDEIEIVISDQGKGIPKSVMSHLFEKGFSHEKSHGTGSGLYQAKKNLPQYGGDIIIESKLNEGTKVKVKIPKTSPPDWFLKSINLEGINRIVVVDDDPVIEEVWASKFLRCIDDIVYFQSPETFAESVNSLKVDSGTLFLIDYEFEGYSTNGIDLIKENRLEKSVLVTNKLNDGEVFKRCQGENIQLLPKNLISSVPIEKRSSIGEAFIIDDDQYFIRALQEGLLEKNIRIEPLTLDQAKKREFPREAKIFVDSKIHQKDDGIEFGKELAIKSKNKAILLTGFDKCSVVNRHKNIEKFFCGFIKKTKVNSTVDEVARYLGH